MFEINLFIEPFFSNTLHGVCFGVFCHCLWLTSRYFTFHYTITTHPTQTSFIPWFIALSQWVAFHPFYYFNDCDHPFYTVDCRHIDRHHRQHCTADTVCHSFSRKSHSNHPARNSVWID